MSRWAYPASSAGEDLIFHLSAKAKEEVKEMLQLVKEERGPRFPAEGELGMPANPKLAALSPLELGGPPDEREAPYTQ